MPVLADEVEAQDGVCFTGLVRPGPLKGHPAVVAQDDVFDMVVAAGHDNIIGGSAHHHVRSVAGHDRVVAPGCRIRSLDAEQDLFVGEFRKTAVT